MKGIVLAGGAGTRLYPSTLAISKQLLTLYDKPMVYYPISNLMLAGIRDILLISSPRDIVLYQELFGDGSHLGLQLSYAVQAKPRGIADAFLVGESFIGNDEVCLVLGDNVFYGYGFGGRLKKAAKMQSGAIIFGYYVSNPQEFGVVTLRDDGSVESIEEKPVKPKSNYAVPGLYFYDNSVVTIAKSLSPSKRGELEITDIHNEYLAQGKLHVELFGRGMAWLDTGTHDSMLEASNFIRTVQKRQGLYIACLEEISYRNGWISREQLEKQANKLIHSDYGQYLMRVASCEF